MRRQYLLTKEQRHTFTRDWPRTAGGHKLMCPLCGASGYSGGSWIDNHTAHVTASCGKTVTERGLGAHRGHCQDCP
jgi:hypothetical protein